MPNYKFLFVMEILYKYFEEFTLDNLYFAILKHFKDDKDIHLITGIFVNFLSQLKFTREEIKQLIELRKKSLSEEELEKLKKELENHKIYEKGKAID